MTTRRISLHGRTLRAGFGNDAQEARRQAERAEGFADQVAAAVVGIDADVAAATGAADAAASALASFGARYLGAADTDPPGTHLHGALYWNSPSASMRVYDLGASAWLAAASISQADPVITSANPSGSYAEYFPLSGVLTFDSQATAGVIGDDAGAVTIDPATGAWSLEVTQHAVKSAYSFSFTATSPNGKIGTQEVTIGILVPLVFSVNALKAQATEGADADLSANIVSNRVVTASDIAVAGGPVTALLSLASDPGHASPVDAADFNGTFPSATLTIEEGQNSSAAFTAAIYDDTAVENVEGGLFVASNPSLGSISAGSAPFLIYSEDMSSNVPTISSFTRNNITYHFSPTPYRVQPGFLNDPEPDIIVGPTTVTHMTPASEPISGNFVDELQAPFTDSWVHGAMLNPGHEDRVGGNKANNADNQPQGYFGLPQTTTTTNLAYAHSANDDPGATGQPINLVDGDTLVKTVSYDGRDGRGGPFSQLRPGGRNATALPCAVNLGAANSLRFGTATKDSTFHYTTDDWDVTVFKNISVPNRPTIDEIAAITRSYWHWETTDQVNSGAVSANAQGYSSYPRDTAHNKQKVLMFLHSDAPASEKIQVLNEIYKDAIDIHEREQAGGKSTGTGPLAGGNGSPLRMPVLTMVTAALRNASAQAKLALMVDQCRRANEWAPEEQMIAPITMDVVLTPRPVDTYNPPRPQDRYERWMEGADDFRQVPHLASSGASNLDAPYRMLKGNGGVGSVIAAWATEGVPALWGQDDHTFQYYKGYRENYARVGRWPATQAAVNSEAIDPFVRDMIEALNPLLVEPAPVTLWAKVLGGTPAGGSTLWVHCNKALDESQAVDPANYIVKVNGTPVAGVTRAAFEYPPANGVTSSYTVEERRTPYAIFNKNFGLNFPIEVTSNDVVQISYTPGAGGRLRSAVDHIEVAAFTDLPAENITESIGGTNAAYPKVRFTGSTPDRYKTAIAEPLGAASPYLTLWIPHLKLLSTPSANVELFGASGGAPTFELTIHTDRRFSIFVRDSLGNFIFRTYTAGGLALNTDYSILIDADVTDPSAATGRSLMVNGAASNGTTPTWAGAAGSNIGWSRPAIYNLGRTDGTGFDGEFGGLWLSTTERVTDPAQRAKFTSLSNGSLDIGTLGDGITGAQPSLFLVGNAGQFNASAGINRGAGPKFFQESGAVSDVVAGQAEWK